jgi:hypothetical protein
MTGPSSVPTSFVRTAACRQPCQSNPFPPSFLCQWCLDHLLLGARPPRVVAVAEPHHNVKRAKTRPLHKLSPPRSLHAVGAICFHPAHCQPRCYPRQARAPNATPLCMPMCCAHPITPFCPAVCAHKVAPSAAVPDATFSRLRPVKHKRQERGTACPSRTAGTASTCHVARWHSCLAARTHAPAPISALVCTAPLCCTKHWHAPR